MFAPTTKSLLRPCGLVNASSEWSTSVSSTFLLQSMNEHSDFLRHQIPSGLNSNQEYRKSCFNNMSTIGPPSGSGDNGLSHFTNPVIWEDLPDMDMIRVDEIYYMSCSSFHYSPGAPILRSTNLVDWKYVGHSIPELPGARFRLNGQHSGSYVKGVWASTMQYRKSNRTFYWYGPIQGTERTFIYTAKNPSDVWTPLPPINKFFYDLGLLIDEDDTMYLAYGTKIIWVSRLSKDGTGEAKCAVSPSTQFQPCH